MSFASPVFLWYFLPAVLLVHWVLPVGFRNGVLAVFSLAFYAVGGQRVRTPAAGPHGGQLRGRPAGSAR